MPWAQYNLSDGFVNATIGNQVSDEDLAGIGRAQIFYEEGINAHDYFVDVAQSPHVLTPIPAINIPTN